MKEYTEVNQSFGNLYTDVKFTHSKAVLFIYRKSLLTADFLVGQGEVHLEAEQFGNHMVKIYNHNNCEFFGTLSVQVTLKTEGSAIDSLFSMVEDNKKQALSPIKMTDNLRQFVFTISPIVNLHYFIVDIYTWRNPLLSAFVCCLIYLLNQNSAWIPGLSIVLLWLWMMHSAMKKHCAPHTSDAQFTKNLIFIQEFMGNFIIMSEIANKWIERVIYWTDPECAKKFQKLIEILFIPALIFGYYFSVLNFVPYILIWSIIVKSPFLKSAINIVVCRLKTKADVIINASINKQEEKQEAKEEDQRVYRIYENQRLWLGKWKDFTLPTERRNWSDVNGEAMTRESVIIPQGWKWIDEWHIDSILITDWEYATDFTKQFHAQKEFFDLVRRRCWIRHAAKE